MQINEQRRLTAARAASVARIYCRSMRGFALSACLFLAGCTPGAVAPRPTPQAADVTLSAFPSTVLRSGSTVTITGVIRDASGTRLQDGTAATLASSDGTLSKTDVTTNSAGEFQVTLTSSAPTTVRASSSGHGAAVEIAAADPFTISLNSDGGIAGGQVTVTVAVTPTSGIASPPNPATVTASCRSGAGTTTLEGRLGQQFLTCVYPSAGTYAATATATAANGWTRSASRDVTVGAGPAALTIIATTSFALGGGRAYVFSTGGTLAPRSWVWHFGDGAARATSDAGVYHSYQSGGTYTVTVTGYDGDGREIGSASTVLRIDFN